MHDWLLELWFSLLIQLISTNTPIKLVSRHLSYSVESTTTLFKQNLLQITTNEIQCGCPDLVESLPESLFSRACQPISDPRRFKPFEIEKFPIIFMIKKFHPSMVDRWIHWVFSLDEARQQDTFLNLSFRNNRHRAITIRPSLCTNLAAKNCPWGSNLS